MNEIYKSKAYARACILGDKGDLLGNPVITSTIPNLELTIDLTKNENDEINYFSDSLKLYGKYDNSLDLNSEFKYLNSIIKRKENEITHGFDCNITSNIPIGAGVSSSAAISVSFIKALNNMFKLNMNNYEIAELAYITEHDDCQISCGRMDQYAIAFQGTNYIKTGKQTEVETLNPLGENISLIIADSNEHREAKTILNEIQNLINEDNTTILDGFALINQIVKEGKKAIIENDYFTLGNLMTQQQQIETNYFNPELSTPSATEKINLLCHESTKIGALGAKQMGAGGGGCLEILCALHNRKNIEKILEDNGATIIA